MNGIVTTKRTWLGGRERIDANDCVFSTFNAGATKSMRRDQLALHVTRFDGSNRTTHIKHPSDFILCFGHQLRNLGLNDNRPGEQVVVLKQIALIREHLLNPQRPLLIPRARKTQRFIPGGQLNRTRTCIFRQRHSEHLKHDSLNIVFRLRLRQTK